MLEDSMVALRPEGGVAAKTLTEAGVVPPDFAILHRTHIETLSGLPDLVRWLSALSSDPEWYVIRGGLVGGAELIRRKHKGADATIISTPRRWVLLDLDHVREDVSAEEFASRPGYWAGMARDMLPEPFRRAGAWWQATASAGIRPGLRLRLGFWCDRFVTDREWKVWASSWGVSVDLALFTPSQPHFTSAPILVGVNDPCPDRFGVLEGEACVVVPHIEREPSRDAEAALHKAKRAASKSPEGTRRTMLNGAAYGLAKRFSESDLPAARIYDELSDAGDTSGLPAAEVLITLRSAIEDGRAEYEAEHLGWRDTLRRSEDGEVMSTQANTTIIIGNSEAFRARVAVDARSQAPVWVRSPTWGPRIRGARIDVADIARIVELLQADFGVSGTPSWVEYGLRKVAQEVPEYDEIRDYVRSLPPWDGQLRCGTFFIRHLGVPDTELNRAMANVWFVQAIRRAGATPELPVKADLILLLMGPQGLGKSSVLRLLCPISKYFRDRLPPLSSKDANTAVSGAWIVEMAEFPQRAGSVEVLKAFTSCVSDAWRLPYTRDEVEVPRRCVFAITTNDREPLVDPTGNRRFLPMMCHHVADFAKVSAERDMIWAEAISLVAAGHEGLLPSHLAKELAELQQEVREDSNQYELLAGTLLAPAPSYGIIWEPGQIVGADRRYRWLRTDQAVRIIEGDPHRTNHMRSVKEALRRFGWEEVRIQGRRAWTPPAAWYPQDAAVVTEQN